MWCWYAARSGWIVSNICVEIIFQNWGGGGGGGSKFETEHKIWRIVWLVGVYCESDGPQ